MRYIADYTQNLGDLADRVGYRGRSMADMARLGIHIPPGFAISDVVCRRFLETGDIPDEAWEEITEAVAKSAAAFSAIGRPILFAVRSSPRVPMQGVLNAALYLGTTTDLVTELATVSGDELAALVTLGFLESVARLRGVPAARYRALVADLGGHVPASAWDSARVEAIAGGFASLIVDESQRPIPGELAGQLREGIEGVFASWDGREARRFRRRNEIDDDEGMAIVVHPMVFGEGSPDSGAGTVYSRDPHTGERTATGVYAPGESRPGIDLDDPRLGAVGGQPVFGDIAEVARCLEREWRELTRIDFVRERGENWVIAARPAERTAQAAVRVAVELVDEGVLDVNAALLGVEPERLAGLIHPQLVYRAVRGSVGQGCCRGSRCRHRASGLQRGGSDGGRRRRESADPRPSRGASRRSRRCRPSRRVDHQSGWRDFARRRGRSRRRHPFGHRCR